MFSGTLDATFTRLDTWVYPLYKKEQQQRQCMDNLQYLCSSIISIGLVLFVRLVKIVFCRPFVVEFAEFCKSEGNP